MPSPEYGAANDLPGRNGQAGGTREHEAVDGELEMHCAYALGASGMIGDNEIRQLLEKSL